jgi:hypothetical protein
MARSPKNSKSPKRCSCSSPKSSKSNTKSTISRIGSGVKTVAYSAYDRSKRAVGSFFTSPKNARSPKKKTVKSSPRKRKSPAKKKKSPKRKTRKSK